MKVKRKPRSKQLKAYSKFYELYAGEFLQIITKLRTVETLEDTENGTVTTKDMPMILEVMLLDECETYYHFGDPDIGVTNSIVKSEVVHVAIIPPEPVKVTLVKSPVDKSELN